ncbi:MAG: hypothetical protein JNJ49_04740 [Bdellovibrionaceae bacterium]|nr:hypothetical protein [Pseudobdellovibrionaceae bacterium]
MNSWLKSPEGPLPEKVLREMSADELFFYEDSLLLKNEMSTEFRIRASGGRLVVFVLSAVFFAAYMMAMAIFVKSIPEQQRPLFTFPGFFLALGLGAFTGHMLWKHIGANARFWVRSALHYWPVTLYLVAAAALLFKK